MKLKDRIIIKKGKKISLVVPEKEDILLWYQGRNDKLISQFMGGLHKIHSLESQEKNYENLVSGNGDKIGFSIMINKTNRIIGYIGMNPDYFNKTSMFGIGIYDSKEHSKGYGTESLVLMLDYAFKVQGLRKVKLGCIASNEKGIAAYKKVGFNEVGRFKKESYSNGEYIDDVLMEIFKEDFYKLNKL